MKVLFITNIPSPYRTEFFNEFGKYCDLTVLFEKALSDERDISWQKYAFNNFEGIILNGKSTTVDTAFCPSIIKYVKNEKYDHIIISNFTSITGMLLIFYLKTHHIEYFLESDGGFAKDGKGLKEWVKKLVISGAKGYFSTSKEHDKYYLQYGAEANRILRYPFTSVSNNDLILSYTISSDIKANYKKLLYGNECKSLLIVWDESFYSHYNSFENIFYILCENNVKVTVLINGYNNINTYAFSKYNIDLICLSEITNYYDYLIAADCILIQSNKMMLEYCYVAMTFSLPIINIIDGVDDFEFLSSGINGIVVQVEDIQNKVNDIILLLNSDDKKKNIGRCNLKFSLQQLCTQCNMKNYIEKSLIVLRDIIRRSARAHLGIDPNSLVLLSVGQFIHRKGYDILLKAIPEDVVVYFVGGEPTEEYLNLVKERGLTNVIFKSFKEKQELAYYFKSADVFVHPTREDIWGLVINEALVYGVPFITTDRCIAGIDFVSKSECGIIVKTENIEDLTDSINKIKDIQLRQQMMVNGLSVALEYTFEKMAKKHLDILSKE